MSSDNTPPRGPLAGLTVLDLTLALAGPFATFLLAGLGARVIKIENPESPDPCRQNPPYLGCDGVSLGRTSPDDVSVSALNRLRGKYGVTLNLKRPGARDVFARLLREADIVVENISAGTLERLGVGYLFARSINPRVIYCSISGFGAGQAPGTGKAMDNIIQALSGLMMTSGTPEDRRSASAFRWRIWSHLSSAWSAFSPRSGRVIARLTPFGIYESADGHVAICAPTEQFARGVFAAIGHPEFEHDARFATRDARVADVDEMTGHIAPCPRTRRRSSSRSVRPTST